ncbi:hypothetical protein IMZ48_27560 [Candidatus Bathyarchaeota archaeon]|nr:hypothetical protein [Candidatus Bathyarchaeota archaeon]
MLTHELALTSTAAGKAACAQEGFKRTGYEEVALTRRGRLGGVAVDIIYIYPSGTVLGRDGHGTFHSKSEVSLPMPPCLDSVPDTPPSPVS